MEGVLSEFVLRDTRQAYCENVSKCLITSCVFALTLAKNFSGNEFGDSVVFVRHRKVLFERVVSTGRQSCWESLILVLSSRMPKEWVGAPS